MASTEKEQIQLDPRTAAVFKRKGYKVTDKISEGSFGKVYKGKRTKDGIKSAVKVMDLDRMDKFTLEYLPRELEMLQKINHPCAIKVYDIFKSNKRIYIFMEYAPNGCLTDQCKDHPIPENKGRKWFRQTSEAMVYLHFTLRVAHRDIKTDNILLDANFDAKLSDYGFTRNAEPGDASHTICGTVPYYSPELLKGLYDPFKADIWAMGVMLYIILVSRYPFKFPEQSKREEYLQMYQFQQRRVYRERKAFNVLSEGAKSLIYKLLEPDQEKRLDARQMLNHRWTQGGQSTPSPKSPKSPRR